MQIGAVKVKTWQAESRIYDICIDQVCIRRCRTNTLRIDQRSHALTIMIYWHLEHKRAQLSFQIKVAPSYTRQKGLKDFAKFGHWVVHKLPTWAFAISTMNDDWNLSSTPASSIPSRPRCGTSSFWRHAHFMLIKSFRKKPLFFLCNVDFGNLKQKALRKGNQGRLT